MSFAEIQYRAQFFAFDGTFGIGALLVEPVKIKNVGWGRYLNDVAESFVTLDQDDPQLVALRTYGGKVHIRILRSADGGPWDIMWAGWGFMESDANERDVVLYNYGYLAGLWTLHTDWDQSWTNQEVGTIVSELWTRAKTTLTQSRVAFVTTGTIEAPVTTSGGATAIVLPSYRTYYKRILLVLQELAALGASDTNNGVVFEITHSATPTFNLWKNYGADRTNLIWQYGGAILRFREIKLPVLHRNQLLAVGSPATSAVFRYDVSDGGDINNWGRMQESLYLSWVRDELELQRVTDRRKAMALREDIYLTLTFRKGRIIPPGATGATFDLGDRVKVRIDRGLTSIDEYRLITGVQVIWSRGAETIRVITQQRAGA